MFLLVSISSCPFAVHGWEGYGFIRYITSDQAVVVKRNVSPFPSLFQAELFLLLEPFLVLHVLLLLTILVAFTGLTPVCQFLFALRDQK